MNTRTSLCRNVTGYFQNAPFDEVSYKHN